MSDALAASFDALPYRHGAVPHSHPARLGAIARLLHAAAAPPDACRVLELGCGEGMNLLPLAERLPGSRFVGVDFSPGQIATAEAARAAVGLANVEFVCRDLREFEPEAGAFDYVIAHGVYSWVPPEVKERLLAITARALSPQGVAFITYNVHPAWGVIGSLRAVLKSLLVGDGAPGERLARLLPALEKSFAAQRGPHAELMRAAIAEMRSKPVALLLHDELEILNEPVTFLDFTAHAQRHGLHYLGEAEFASLPYEHLPAAVREPLAELAPDFAQSQQFLDLLGHRRIRSSLLTLAPPATRNTLDPSVISECAIRLHLRPVEPRIDLAASTPLRLQGRHGFQLAVEKREQKAFFAALCEAQPGPILFRDAIARAREWLDASAALDAALLAAGVARLFAVDQCDVLLAGAGDWLRASASPQPSALMRYQARGEFEVTNRWHENLALTSDERRWVAGESVEVNTAALLRSGLGV